MDKKTVEVRPLAEEELGFVEHRLSLDSFYPDKHRKRLDIQQREEAVYLIAWYGGVPVGHGLLKWAGSGDGAIAARLKCCPDVEDLFVHPDYRSRGIGARLLECAEGMAVEKGLPGIGLGVSVENARALALYRRLGYEDAGFGEYIDRWHYTDENGHKRWEEETCTYMLKRLL